MQKGKCQKNIQRTAKLVSTTLCGQKWDIIEIRIITSIRIALSCIADLYCYFKTKITTPPQGLLKIFYSIITNFCANGLASLPKVKRCVWYTRDQFSLKSFSLPSFSFSYTTQIDKFSHNKKPRSLLCKLIRPAFQQGSQSKKTSCVVSVAFIPDAFFDRVSKFEAN